MNWTLVAVATLLGLGIVIGYVIGMTHSVIIFRG